MQVLNAIGGEVLCIYCIDDFCPDETGQYIQKNCSDPRVNVLFHKENQGVGGATITGWKQAVADGFDIIVKIDGDNQMDPAILPKIIRPIVQGLADYTKGNRFYTLDSLSGMPNIRIIGNAGLSFISKFSSGYWDIFDPTNGYTAIHSTVINTLQLDKVDKRFFFESDILFRLNIIRAVVADVPISSSYGYEVSNLRILPVLFSFPLKHFKNFLKRIFYNYFLRNFSFVSLELLLGFLMLLFGIIWVSLKWFDSFSTGIVSTSGTVFIGALPILVGIQFLLAFLNYDMTYIPKTPIHLEK